MILHLRAFATVAELKSFSRAADELLIGQPLLSRRIKSLEAEIGGELFDRSRRQIAVTDLGQTLLGSAQDVLARAELFEQFVRVAQGGDRLRIGIPPDGDRRAVARIVKRAAEGSRAIDVVEAAGLARDHAFENGSLDIVLLSKPPGEVGFIVKLGLASARPLIVRSPTAGDTRAVRLDEIRPRRADPRARHHIVVTAEDDRPVFIDGLVRAATRAGLARSQIDVGMSTPAALVRVLAGDDLLLCSRQFAVRNGLVWAPLADQSIRRTYQLVVTGSLERDGAVHELLAQLAPLLGAAVDAVQASRREGIAADTGAHPLVEAWR